MHLKVFCLVQKTEAEASVFIHIELGCRTCYIDSVSDNRDLTV